MKRYNYGPAPWHERVLDIRWELQNRRWVLVEERVVEYKGSDRYCETITWVEG